MPGIISTVIVGVVIALVVFLSVRKLWKDKKSGKSCCGGNCSCCSGCSAARNAKLEKAAKKPESL